MSKLIFAKICYDLTVLSQNKTILYFITIQQKRLYYGVELSSGVAIADKILLGGVLPHLVVSSVLEEEKLLPKIM
jgi:hypothetical protein